MSDDLPVIERRIGANGITFACDECGYGGLAERAGLVVGSR